MESALIVSYSEKSAAVLSEVLMEAAVSNITTIAGAGEARRLMIEKDFDICIINAPLLDEPGDNLACHIADQKFCEVILLVKADFYDEISEKTERYGVITISKPINKALLWNALKLAQATHYRIQAMQSENRKLVQKIEDIKIVDRAKCILISHFTMTETEAHRYIEKQAMDQRATRREVAEAILKTYES